MNSNREIQKVSRQKFHLNANFPQNGFTTLYSSLFFYYMNYAKIEIVGGMKKAGGKWGKRGIISTNVPGSFDLASTNQSEQNIL